MRTSLTTTAMLLSLGLGSLAFAQQTTTEPKADEPRPATERRENRVENRDGRQDNRQENRGDRQENRDTRQDDRQADNDKRQENRQERREQIRERLANQLNQADQNGRHPIETMFVLIDRIVDKASSADVANASLPQVQETYAMLRQFDRDNNGTITQQELVAGQAAAHQTRTNSAIARLDTNKDGKLSPEEATAGQFNGTFEQLDKNKDGSLDRDEVTASYTAMRDNLLRRAASATTPSTTTSTTTAPDQPKD